jgi:hypothetical protein
MSDLTAKKNKAIVREHSIPSSIGRVNNTFAIKLWE